MRLIHTSIKVFFKVGIGKSKFFTKQFLCLLKVGFGFSEIELMCRREDKDTFYEQLLT